MNQKLPRHSDIDADLWPGLNIHPLAYATRLGCIASIMIFIVSWLGLIAVGATGLIDLALWHFISLPIAAWLVLLALPILVKSRRASLKILDAIAKTAEAWFERAGFSIDLNRDGYTGYVQVEPVKTEVITPAVFTGPGGTKLLAQAETAIPELSEAAPPETTPQRRLWNLPGGVKCPEDTVRTFVERVFIVGYSRDTWVGSGKPLEREVYDALINLLCQTQIIEGRKAGHAGKLTVDNAEAAKRVLGLA